jgi:ATP phosphoribosyltransferase
MSDTVRIALPTGDLRAQTASFLANADIGVGDYGAGSRALRFELPDINGVARVFREKDIPVQVALGSYDIGICSLSWIEELNQRFPGHEVVRLCALGYGDRELWLATARNGVMGTSPRIVTEYPNIADSLARRLRLPRYRVFGVWGAAENYPPEDADVVLIEASGADAVSASGLSPLAKVLDSSAWLIANRHSLSSRDLSAAIAKLLARGLPALDGGPRLEVPAGLDFGAAKPEVRRSGRLRLALPDGHAQVHTVAALRASGLDISGYDEDSAECRPRLGVEGIDVKVIRPQDMPQQVALGQFDLAVTGRDWLFDHKVQFPASPVEEVVDLRRSRYGLAAIVKGVDADTVAGAVVEWRRRTDRPIRVASEYPNIADHFARERHLGRYSVIPIAGASEGFVPDDAEILIEGIDTGSSVRANNLTVLERFFESTNCVIANTSRPEESLRDVFESIVAKFASGAADLATAASGA